MSQPKKKRKSRKFLVFLIFLLLLLVAFLIGLRYYNYIYEPNVIVANPSASYLFITTGSNYGQVKGRLSAGGFVRDLDAFDWVAQKKGYPSKVRPGRYHLKDGMNNNELVNLLRSGKQEPVRVVFQSIRTKQDLAGKISHQLETDSAEFLGLLQNNDFLKKFDVSSLTVFTMFIPNTYEFFWNTTPEKFFERMSQEQRKFWNHPRMEKAGQAGLTIPEVVTLASIVDKETAKDDEKPLIAGVYINRLHKGWPLQADPTLIFAWNDYSIRRVLNKHKEIESPYNTYLYTGLPPGPICLPSIASIESVLGYEKHSYMYFCAREDLSGYHNFAVTLAQHNRNAEKYQAALKKLNIH